MLIKRILSFIGIFAAVFIGGLVTVILFPQPLFSHSYEYKNFEIYSNTPIDQTGFNEAIDQAIENLQESELYDADYQYDVFIAHQSIFNKIDDVVLGRWSVARAIDNNVIIKRKVEVEGGIVQNDQNQFSLVYVLAHEMTHCLQENKYGKWMFNPFNHPPMWKLEGYPEYLGRRVQLEDEAYSLVKGIEHFLLLTDKNNNEILQITENESTPYIYYKGRLMVEYLMDIKGLSYDEIIDESIDEGIVYTEMIEWYKENNK